MTHNKTNSGLKHSPQNDNVQLLNSSNNPNLCSSTG